jgi:hypothetical protein
MNADIEKLGLFYLGRTSAGPLLYDSRHLLTHAVIVGMTGSGKTGLGIALLEEAAIDGIPAIVIDPKGDLANLLLTFPDLRGESFAPWVPEGKDAAAEADAWRRGLEASGQDGERIARLRASADVAVYTPGSTAGRAVSVLRSLEPPPEALRADPEAVRERVGAVASSLLALVGVDADPVKSREHILLTTILSTAWARGEALDLGGLIGKIQDPKVAKVGVLDLETFYPKADRFELAVLFNNLLASPGFEAWLEGEPLDPSALLWTREGKPRVSIFSIAHLGDSERMFFVALLLNQVLAWVRAQPGTSSLRALLYMDEIFGYFPPVANPPSKRPLLTLLKQARAFGFGVVLATQNPVDLDYKGLSNAGTWIVGRLQTERDKMRVVEGLEGALGTFMPKAEIERLLAGLQARHFLLHDVHAPAPQVFESRHTLSYLRGPLTRQQLRQLQLQLPAPTPTPTPSPLATNAAAATTHPTATSKPILDAEITQVFHGSGTYVPHVLGAAKIHFRDPKTDLDVVREVVFETPILEGPVAVRWENARWVPGRVEELSHEPAPGASFAPLPASAAKAKSYAAWAKDFVTWLAQNQGLSRLRSPSLEVLSKPGEPEQEFRARLALVAREARDAAIDELKKKYAPKLEALDDKIRRADQVLAREQQEARGARQDQYVSAGASLVGAMFGRGGVGGIARGISGAARRANAAEKQAADVARATENRQALIDKWNALNRELQAELAKVAATIDPAREALETVTVKPKKTQISVQLVALAWRGQA